MKLVENIFVTEDVTLFSLCDAPADISHMADVFKLIADAGIDVDMISQFPLSGASSGFSFTVSDKDFVPVLAIASELRNRSPKTKISVSSGNCKLTVSGDKMKKTLGIGFGAYLVIALFIAIVGGIMSEMSVPQFILWLLFAALAAEASELIVGVSAMYSGWFPGFATALIFLIIGMLLGFPMLPLGLLVGFTAATGPCFSDMAYDLKCGYILRGNGANPELEKEGRKQQYFAELMGFGVAFIMMIFFAHSYFDQGLYVAVSNTFVTTIEAGASSDVAMWLLIWAIPGAIIQLLGGHRQLGILFATGLLVGNIINGLTIFVGLLIRFIAVRVNKENEQTLNILGAGALAGAAIYSFFTATLGLFKKD